MKAVVLACNIETKTALSFQNTHNTNLVYFNLPLSAVRFFLKFNFFLVFFDSFFSYRKAALF